MLTTVLFDLDGTLFDTAPDLAFVLNKLLTEHQRPTLSLSQIRPFASTGVRGLLHLGFKIAESDPDYPALRQQFLDYYQANLSQHTQLFNGMETVLTELEKNNLRWGVVTNKMQRFAAAILQAFKLDKRCVCIIGGDDVSNIKPAPDSLLLACEKLGIAPQTCIYVGDAETDVIAAKRANMPNIAATYGYLLPHDEPAKWQADKYVDNPLQILDCLLEFRCSESSLR